MSDFERQGFFSVEAQQIGRTLAKEHDILWTEARAVNEFCQAFQYELDVHKHSVSETLSAVLYARTLSTYQGFLVVLERGMVQQAKMLLRCAFESLFPLVAISRDANFAGRILVSEELERLKGLNKLIRYWQRSGDPEGEIENARKLAVEIKAQLATVDGKKLSIVDTAEAAGLVDWYDTVYSLLSNTVHSSVRSLEDHLHVSASGDIEAMKNEPSCEDADKLLATGMESMLNALLAASVIFGGNVHEFVEDSSGRIRSAYKSSSSNLNPTYQPI